MRTEDSWTSFWRSDAPDVGTITFNYTEDVPSAGSGGCLSIQSYGQTGAYVYQEVTIVPGNSYTFGGACKNGTLHVLENTWAELILSSRMPAEGEDFNAGTGDFRYQMSSWEDEPYNSIYEIGFDGTFEEDFRLSWIVMGSGGDLTLESNSFVIPDTTTVTTWYVVIKGGCRYATAGNTEEDFNLLYDEISPVDGGHANSIFNRNTQNSFLFNLYPNPSEGFVNIELYGENSIAYQVHNTMGMLIESNSLNGSSVPDLRNMSKGLYYITVSSDSNLEIQRLLLK